MECSDAGGMGAACANHRKLGTLTLRGRLGPDVPEGNSRTTTLTLVDVHGNTTREATMSLVAMQH